MSDKMKAVVMRGPNQYGVEQVDIPTPGVQGGPGPREGRGDLRFRSRRSFPAAT